MSEIKDGGPAFPLFIPATPQGPETVNGGMTLRDYFAAKAMAKVEFAEYYGALATVKSLTEDANRCYRIADAMLKARK